MTAARRSLGARGEELACRHLSAHGYSIIERNARTRHGELDIVAQYEGTLVFVEVKTARAEAAAGPEHPVHAVGNRKRRRLRLLARAWMADRRPGATDARIDVIGVTLPAGGRGEPAIEHLESAV